MATNNFIPEVWAPRILANLKKNLVYASVANRDYEGEIKNYGDTVHINSITTPTVAPYTKNSTNLSPEVLTDANKQLAIDQANSFSFMVDSIDRAQQNPKLMDQAMADAAHSLKDTADQYISSLMTTSTGLLVVDTDAEINSANAIENILLIGEKLSDYSVPQEGRWLIIPPWLHSKLALAKIKTLQDGVVAANGLAGDALGFKIYVSQNVSKEGAYSDVVAGCPSSLTYADQLLELEAIKIKERFGDNVRGLHVFGAKVVRPSATAVLLCKSKAEAQ